MSLCLSVWSQTVLFHILVLTVLCSVFSGLRIKIKLDLDKTLSHRISLKWTVFTSDYSDLGDQIVGEIIFCYFSFVCNTED